MAENETFEEPDAGDDQEGLARLKRSKLSRRLVPRMMLQQAFGSEDILAFAKQPARCLVIEVPGPDWITPISEAASRLCEWDTVITKSTRPRSRNAEDDRSDAVVSYTLANGGRVLGVSHDPQGLLPETLMTSADLRIKVLVPDAKLLASVIETVCGDMPDSLVEEQFAGLGFDEITAAIRFESTAIECVERLRRAVGSKKRLSAAVTDAPELSDLQGYGEAKTWALNLAEDLAAWRRGEISLDHAERMIVLASPPGMGKTTFAKSLARTTGLPLIATSVGQWFANSPGYLDSVIKQIDAVFAEARANAPSIVLLDEIEGIPSRATLSSRGADWWTPVIGHMLTTLDGAETGAKDLIVIGATNHPEKLDPALIRPGRLSRIIHIPLPSEEEIAEIFRQHLGGDLKGEDLSEVAMLANGATGANVVEWIKIARGAARRAGRTVEIGDLINAVCPKTMQSQDALWRTAVHEAGHAVVSHFNGTAVISLSIVQRGMAAGHTAMLANDVNSREDVEREVVIKLAGRAAEEVLLSAPSAGAGGASNSDLASATRWLAALHLSFGLGERLSFRADVPDVLAALERNPPLADQVECELRDLYVRALDQVRSLTAQIEAVAAELLKRRQMDGVRFLEILEA